MLVGDIMHRDLTALAEETTLLEAISVMVIHKTSGLPVLNNEGRVAGFLSEKDILNAVIPGYLSHMDDNFRMPDLDKIQAMAKRVGNDPTKDYMVKDCITFEEHETLSNAIMIFFRRKIRRAPVVRDGMLIGIVDREKIMRGLVQDKYRDEK